MPSNPLRRVYSLSVKTSALVRSSPRLSEVIRLSMMPTIAQGDSVLDEAVIKRFLEGTNVEEWTSVLLSVRNAMFSAKGNSETTEEFRYWVLQWSRKYSQTWIIRQKRKCRIIQGLSLVTGLGRHP